MTKKDKEAQLKAKLLKMKLAVKADGVTTAKAKINKLKKNPIKTMEKRGLTENILDDAASEAGINEKQSPSYIAKDHHHKISFRGHKIGGFKGASLSGQSGKYAKYWLLNAKETNGNGWGIAAHTAKENMKKFIGRPLVVTASSWHGASEYGDEYEHPYLPTNDINAILNHQEKFRVGSIVDVFEDSHGDWFASIEMLPKFASSRLPPFCSPAIYQLDASEAEGQISKWEALHLAALTENPAYGARIALLKGTCVGTDNECKVQFKGAKQESGIECPVKEKQKKVKSKLSKLKKKQKISSLKQRIASPIIQETGEGINYKIIKPKQPLEGRTYGFHKVPIHPSNTTLIRPKDPEKYMDLVDHFRKIQNKELPTFVHGTVQQSIRNKDVGGLSSPFGGKLKDHATISRGINQELKKGDILMRRVGGKPGQEGYGQVGDTFYIENDSPKGELFKYESKYKRNNASPVHKTSKLKARLAGLGEQNMTYQDSKKVKIHKKKHPEVRKAKSSVEDILRGKGRSVDGSHAQSTFLSSEGDFIGGGDKTEAHRSQVGLTDDNQLTDFQKETGLIRVQNFPINRAGDKKTSLGINSKVNKNQLKSIKDLETGGQTIGFSVGDLGKETTGQGYRDLTKILRERKFLG